MSKQFDESRFQGLFQEGHCSVCVNTVQFYCLQRESGDKTVRTLTGTVEAGRDNHFKILWNHKIITHTVIHCSKPDFTFRG